MDVARRRPGGETVRGVVMTGSGGAWMLRVLEVYENGQPVLEFTAAVSPPRPSPDDPWLWECQFAVEGGFEDAGPYTVYGVDAIAAVQLAIDTLGAHVEELARSHDIRLFGSRDLGFPSPNLGADAAARI